MSVTSRGGAIPGLGCSGGGAKGVGGAGNVVGVATSGSGCGEKAGQSRSGLQRSGRGRDAEGAGPQHGGRGFPSQDLGALRFISGLSIAYAKHSQGYCRQSCLLFTAQDWVFCSSLGPPQQVSGPEITRWM